MYLIYHGKEREMFPDAHVVKQYVVVRTVADERSYCVHLSVCTLPVYFNNTVRRRLQA